MDCVPVMYARYDVNHTGNWLAMTSNRALGAIVKFKSVPLNRLHHTTCETNKLIDLLLA
jgi:hypothetical protein